MQGLLKLPRALLAAVLFCAAIFAGVASADVVVPPLKAHVTDLTSTLTSEQTAALEAKIAAFEQRKGSQVAVLLVPATAPETIAQYGIKVAEQWKLGRKGVDDGAILIIAKDERKLRIEVGRGLEGALPDAIAKRIVAEDIVPLFKQGQFNAGINAGVDRMLKVIDGEPLPEVKGGGWSSSASADDALGWGAMLVVFLGGLLRWIFGALFGSLIAGGIAAGVALFLGLEMAVSLIVGGFVALLCLIGFLMLGFGGGGGLGGGNWGGGGGDFGGGGASGSW